MRVAGAIIALALGLSACVSVGVPPTAVPTATPLPTLAPTAEPPITQPTPQPTPEPPTAEPTAEPTPEGPTPTPDPNATPEPTSLDILPYLASEVTVVNLAAATLTVTVTLVDTESPDEYEVGVFELLPEQVTAQAIVPARFRLEFALGGGATATCVIDIASEEQLQFAVIETGAIITSNGPEPADPAEMVVATASRCHAGEGA